MIPVFDRVRRMTCPTSFSKPENIPEYFVGRGAVYVPEYEDEFLNTIAGLFEMAHHYFNFLTYLGSNITTINANANVDMILFGLTLDVKIGQQILAEQGLVNELYETSQVTDETFSLFTTIDHL